MKSKALTYVMLIVVGIIWYQVFFRVKNNLMGDDTEVPKPNQANISVNAIARDTVELNVDYRDPFHYDKVVKGVSLVSDAQLAQTTPKPIKPRKRKPQFVWPKVSYHGLIRNRSSKHPLALVRVDGLVYNLRKGEEIFNGIIVKDISTDQVVLRSGRNEASFMLKD